jgi:hypothetical protein
MFNLLSLIQLLPEQMTPAQQEAWRALSPYGAKISQAFSPAFWDELVSLFSQIGVCEREDAFLSGLQMGAQLTLGLFPPPPTARTPHP